MTSIETPVLIVGGGPAGLTTATALAQYGVEHVLVNKYEGTAHTPRAHIVNQRTVEIMRHLGCEDDLLAVATPQEMMRNNLWVESLAGREVARLDAWGTGPDRFADYTSSSPSPMANCAQTVFEPMLLQVAKRSGSDVRFGHEFLGFERQGDGFVSTVRQRSTGDEMVIRSRHLVGADGARSKVLDLAGLKVEGRAAMSHAVNIWFRADLSQYLAHRPGVLTWFVPSEHTAHLQLLTLICHKPFTEFVLVARYDPNVDDLSTWDLGRIRPLVGAAVGAAVPDLELLGVAGWQVNGLVAPRYSANGVHCMGDAVHRHPPTNGLGLNMS
ncbi:MAG: FAD-dependent monooxygenase, partial [Actinomycetota bacterium]